MAKRIKQPPTDTILTEEEIDEIMYMLYHTNVGGQAANPPHPSWYKAASEPRNGWLRDLKDESSAKI